MPQVQSITRIILTTFGSLGDLHPFLALGSELKKRGYRVIIATSPIYRDKTETLGLSFHPVRPDIDLEDEQFVQEVTNPKRGPEFLIRDHVMPYVEDSYEDLEALLQPSDTLITHPLSYAAHALAEKKQIRWISATLSPTWYFSAYDPPVMTKLPWLHPIQSLHPMINKPLYQLGKVISGQWIKPLLNLRKRVGLSNKRHPVMKNFLSPTLDLALFSPVFASPQPDWPSQTIATGFPVFDYSEQEWNKKRLHHFLKAGPAPVVFTLGSAVVKNPGQFFEIGIDVVKRLGCRAIFLMEQETKETVAEAFNPDQILIEEYIPYSELFQHAAIIVHQCGIGTTAQALLSGNPSLAVPYSNDQPDNAWRLERLGLARQLNIRHFTHKRLLKELQKIRDNPVYAEHARHIAQSIKHENGVKRACDEVERTINGA